MTRRGFLESLIDFIIRRRAAVLLMLAILTTASVVLALKTRFDFTPQALFSGNGQLLADAEAFSKRFGDDATTVLIALEAFDPVDSPHDRGVATPDGEGAELHDVLSIEALNWQWAVSQRLSAEPEVVSVESLTTLKVLTPLMAIVPLISELPVSAENDWVVRDRFERLTTVTGALISADRRLAAVVASLDPKLGDVEHARRQVSQIQRILDATPPPRGFRVHLSGLPVIRTETIDNLHLDQRTMLPFAGAVYLLALGLMFRRVSGALLPLLAVGIGLAFTFAILTLLGETLNVVSNVLPVLLLIIGISTCVQIVAAYAEESALSPDDRIAAVRRAMVHTVRASFVATLTTLIGFACLITARSIVLKQFGLHAVLGIGCLFICVTLVLGGLFPYFRAPAPAREAGAVVRALLHVATAIGRAVARQPWLALGGSVLAIAAALWAGRTVVIDHYVLETYPESHPTVQTLRLLERQLSGIMPLEISLSADTSERFVERRVVEKIERLSLEAQSLDGVLLARSYVDLHRTAMDTLDRPRKSRDDVGSGRVDEVDWSRRARLNERVFQKHAEVVHYRRFMSADGRHARIMLRTADIGTWRMMHTIRRLEKLLAEAFPPDGPIQASLTGDAYVNTIAMENLIRDLYSSLLTASLAIFGMIALQFRSLRVGLIAALPNLTPLALTLGYMGLRGYHMNVSNVVVFTISLGFADDTTIHFLYRFREHLDSGSSLTDAIDRTFAETGRAILQTSALIMAGLCVLLFSEFLPTKRFGELTLVTLAGNLLGVLLILPACLILFWKRKPPAS